MSQKYSPDRTNEPSRINKGFIEELRRQAEEAANEALPSLSAGAGKATPIDDKIKEERRRKQEIENNNAEKDQELKEQTLKKLFRLLWAETAVIFILAFLQGFGHEEEWFHLDDWSFRIVISATLGQITAMLIIAVQHLFPKKKQK